MALTVRLQSLAVWIGVHKYNNINKTVFINSKYCFSIFDHFSKKSGRVNSIYIQAVFSLGIQFLTKLMIKPDTRPNGELTINYCQYDNIKKCSTFLIHLHPSIFDHFSWSPSRRKAGNALDKFLQTYILCIFTEKKGSKSCHLFTDSATLVHLLCSCSSTLLM